MRAVSKIMGCGSAGQQFTNLLEPRFVNAARIRHNVVHDEFNIAVSCCYDDVGLPLDARRRRRLRDARELGQRATEVIVPWRTLSEAEA